MGGIKVKEQFILLYLELSLRMETPEITREVEVEEVEEAGPIATKYSFSELNEYLAHNTYPAHADKLYKHGLRKRSKFFMHEGGRLFYIGGGKRKENGKPRLVVESVDERRRIIASIHDQAHLGRDKTISEATARYYWPEMYNDICAYVSINNNYKQSLTTQ